MSYPVLLLNECLDLLERRHFGLGILVRGHGAFSSV